MSLPEWLPSQKGCLDECPQEHQAYLPGSSSMTSGALLTDFFSISKPLYSFRLPANGRQRLKFLPIAGFGDAFKGLAIDLCVWIDEKVQRSTFLSRAQGQVSASTQSDPIRCLRSEVLVFVGDVFVRFGNVGRNPVVLVRVEKSPAVVASDCAFSSRFWNWKTDFEPCRKPLGSRQRDEETMEVGPT